MKRSLLISSAFVGIVIAGLVALSINSATAESVPLDYATDETCDTVWTGVDGVVTCSGALIVDRNMWGQDVTLGPDGYLYVGTYWDVGAGDFTAWYMINITTGAVADSFGTGLPGATMDGVAIPPGGDTLIAPRGAAWTAAGDTMYTADFDGEIVKQWNKDQNDHWVFEKDFVTPGAAPHGVQVDPNGRVWVAFYYATDTLYSATDTVSAGGLRVYESDGTEASFSPVNFVTVGAGVDTIPIFNRGLASDNDGNILLSGGNKVLYVIDYATGLTATIHDQLTASSLTKAGVDSAGYIYIGYVGGGNPMTILADDLTLYSMVADTVPTLQRAVAVSFDGKDVYVGAIYSGMNGIRVYHSDAGPNGTYTVSDTLGTVFHYGTTVDSIVGIRPDHVIPEGYALAQNFPNPFNPITTISYEIPNRERVTLTVYDLLGNQVRVLVNEVVNPGPHTLRWDSQDASGRRVSSGVYIYRLHTNSVNMSRRMILVK